MMEKRPALHDQINLTLGSLFQVYPKLETYAI